MKLEINITKGKFWVLTTLLVLVVGVLVFAVSSTVPNPGHSAGEVEGLNDLINRVDALETDGTWLKGNYCVLQIGDSCPDGFKIGSICFDTEDENNEDKRVGSYGANGDLCTGQAGHGSMLLKFCCKTS